MSAGDTPIPLTQISTFLHVGPVNSVEHICVQLLQIYIYIKKMSSYIVKNRLKT